MSSKPEQVLIIEPESELRFRGPLTGTAKTSYIKLINPTTHKVFFKIKTTAPKRYCVRPNSGILHPKDVCEVSVSLQPFDFEPTEKSKHKFMIQTLIASENDTDDATALQEIWKTVNPDQLMDTKLKCVFEIPETATKVKPSATNKPEPGVEEKSKEEVTASPPRVENNQSSEVTDDKLSRAVQEINRLREDESRLRKENMQLKEELLKVKLAPWSSEDTSRLTSAVGTGNMMQNDLPFNMTTTSILIAIGMVVVGYLMGKLI